ncbi:putative exported domain protein [Bordetella holmesii 41130]|nr:putative exported domain protein [Bordetella holmesii ATCC 51541]EWM48699.1 putative exported domain protein [Bordetella holmesii 41130]EWM49890.1 putative exported domain protein [Bordetella holmesii 35009]
MTKLRAVLRHLLIWWLPGLAILAAVVASFVFWLVASQTGSRVLLNAAVQMAGGEVQHIEGSVLKGLRVGRLDVTVADTRIEASNLWLDIDWSELGHRRAYVRALTADRLAVGLPPTAPQSSTQAASGGMPDALSLPVSIDVDRLAVGEFALTRAGQPLPVSLHDIALALHVQREAAARLDIQSLRVDHPEGRVRLTGLLDVQKLAAPWPLAARLEARIAAARPDATFCMEIGDLKASQKTQDDAARAAQQGAYLVTRPEVVQGAASALGARSSMRSRPTCGASAGGRRCGSFARSRCRYRQKVRWNNWR